MARPIAVRPTILAPSHSKCSTRHPSVDETSAVRAGERQVVFHGLAAVFFRNDVVDLKG